MTEPGAAPGIDSVRVGAWLEAHVDGAVAPFEFELIAGGHSNLTYRVVGQDGHPLVLRRPPLGTLLASAHDMGREHRIISSLADTAVPVAPARGSLPLSPNLLVFTRMRDAIPRMRYPLTE